MVTSLDRTPVAAFLDPHPGRAPALVDGDTCVTFGALRQQVDLRRRELDLQGRHLVALAGESSFEHVVTYLALLADRHVPLLVGDRAAEVHPRWQPSARIDADRHGWSLTRSATPPPDLHDDLALLLATSGSTGSPKLVRLSHDNLTSNAAAIATFLELGTDDIGITSLPLHYCYGLSVLHSHLLAGATTVLSRTSVVDRCFADAVHDHGVTTIAGVPHTFEMLEHVGPERVLAPTLRRMTQAGGRLPADRVLRWADRLERHGARLFVMYGQTEATARMAYVPPARLREAPGSIGIAVPGGSLRVDVDPALGLGDDVGELVYRGPNVMLGYAAAPDDLARGRDLDELRTGDLARRDPTTGMIELVGRRSRFVKPFGLRIDLDEVERRARSVAPAAVVVGDDDGIAVIAPTADHARLGPTLDALLALPDHVRLIVDLPLRYDARGKLATADLLTDARRSARSARPGGTADDEPGLTEPADVASVFRDVLGVVAVGDDDTFVSLGGDSLSYVECSIRLEAALGSLPSDWHLVRVGDFRAVDGRRRWRRVDTSILLRSIGILAVVATHMHLAFVPGGAHLMLAVVGYNLSRFVLDIEPVRERVRAGGRALARVAIPTVGWAAIGWLTVGAYGAGTVLLVNNYVGPRSHAGDHWHFWFVEVLVHLTVAVIALTAVPAVRTLDRRHRWAFPLVVVAVTHVARLPWAWMDDWYNLRYRTHGVAVFFALGWLVHRSATTRTRLATSLLTLALVPGYFRHPEREWFIVVGVLVLLWCRQVVLPAVVVRPLATIAAASMWIYLSHFTFWPPLDDLLIREVAYVATILVGVVWWAIARRVEPALARVVRSRHRPRRDRRSAVPYRDLGAAHGHG